MGHDRVKPSVPCIGESHPMHIKEPTSLLAKEQVVVSQSNIRKRVYDVDPSWFTLEGYITVCSLRMTSTRHLNMPYERRSYDVISYHIIAYHSISYRIIAYHSISHISYHIISFHISYHTSGFLFHCTTYSHVQ